MERPKVVSFNESLTCGLCKGYLIEATTITSCLHSFCHSCIVKNLSQQTGEKTYCPICFDLNTPDVVPITTQDLRSDHLLQTIVYKVVPLLYEKEQQRRSDYRNNQNSGKSEIDKKNKNKHNVNFHPSNFHIFSSSDVVNVQISEMETGTDDVVGDDDDDNNNNKKENVDQQLKCRYLLCPVLLKMSHLKKFLTQKIYGSNPGCNVILCCHGKPLEDELCLADICYIFGLQKTTCISIKYIAYLMPNITKKDEITSEVEKEATEPPLGEPSAKILPNCSLEPEESHDANDSSDVFDNSMSSHSASERSDNPENDEKDLISDENDEKDLISDENGEKDLTSNENAGELGFSMENVSAQELSAAQISTVPEVFDANVGVCEQNLDPNVVVKTSAIITSLAEHVSSVSNNNDEDAKSKECEQHSNIQHSNDEKVTELVQEKLAPGDAVADVFVPTFSSPSSASVAMESPPPTVAMAAKLTTPAKEADSDDHDRMSESSSDTTMASPIPASSTTPASMKPCKVVLYRLPTAYFLKSNKKRKHSAANDVDEDDDVEVTESKIDHNVEKSVCPPVKKKKLLDSHPKTTVRNLMVKYKVHLKKLLELKETIQQLRKQNKSKAKNSNCITMTKVVAVENMVEEIRQAEPVISETSLSTTTSTATPISSSSSPIASTHPLAEDSNSNKDDRVENCSIALTTTGISLNDISQSISSSDKQDVSPNLQQIVESIKQDIGHRSEKLESGSTSKGVNILPPGPSEASKQSSATCTSNFISDSPTISKRLSNSTDVSWLLKYARLQAVSNLDKIGTRVVESGGFISRCPDVQMPMILQKRSLLDFVRLPQIRQRCSNRVNNFHNTSAAIRSNLRPAAPASVSNYSRPAYSQVNQASELESLRQYFSALGNQQMESPMNNSNVSSLDLMTYLERNQPLINGMSLGNHSLAACFPLTLNGCSQTARHNFMQKQRQSVSTQTHLDLINQYFCRRSKPAPSVFAGRMRPMTNKRSFNHAFGPDVVTKRTFPASSKKIRYGDEDYLNRIASVNPMIKDNNYVHSGNLETINSHKLFPLSSVMTPTYRHIFTEFPSKSCGPILRPLSSINPNRVICLTPPTDALKKQLICNGPSEITSSQVPSSRPRSSSANAAEVYETLAAGASGGAVDSMKNLAAPLLDMAQSLSSLSYDCQMDDKNTLQNCSLLANQLSPRQKDSFYTIPRKSIFPIFSKSSKLNIPNLHAQNIFQSNKGMFKESSTLSAIPHQTRKCAVPTPQFPLSGWNPANLNANDPLARMNDNVTLDLSKKRKKMDPNVLGEALKADISKNYKAVKSLASLSGMRSSAGNKSSDGQGIMSNTAFLSFLTMTSLSIAKQTPQTTTSLKDKVSPCDREESSSSECPNVIDFRRSLPVTSFKLCDLKNLPFSTLVSTTSNIDGFSFADGSNISNASGKNIDPNTDVKDTTGNCNENDLTQIDAVLLELNGNQSNKSNEVQSHVLDMNTKVTSSGCSTSNVLSSSPHDDPKNQDDSAISSDVVGSVVNLVSDACRDVQKVEDPTDGNMPTSDKIGDNIPTAQDDNREISGTFVQLKHMQENIIVQGCNTLPENDNPDSEALLSDSTANDIKQNIDNDRDIIKSSKSNDSAPLEITTNATSDALQNETNGSSGNGEPTEDLTDQTVKATSPESLTTFNINSDVGVMPGGDDVDDVKLPNSSVVMQNESEIMIIDIEGGSGDVVLSDQMQCDGDDRADDNEEIHTSSIKLNHLEEKFESKDVDDPRPMNSRAGSEISEVNDGSVLDSNASMNSLSKIIE